jgi:IS30 family transposase
MYCDLRRWTQHPRQEALSHVGNSPLGGVAGELLVEQRSPQQIIGGLERTYPGDEEIQVSHETIYWSVSIQTRGGLKREHTQHLRTRRANRQPKGPRPPSSKGRIQGPHCCPAMSSERLATVEVRAVPGHWEGDLIIGERQTAIGTLVER